MMARSVLSARFTAIAAVLIFHPCHDRRAAAPDDRFTPFSALRL
jgi:hypothetical protein